MWDVVTCLIGPNIKLCISGYNIGVKQTWTLGNGVNITPIHYSGLGITLLSQCTLLNQYVITYFSAWGLWFTCKALANSWVPSALISFLLRLQNAREKQKRKVVHIFTWMHRNFLHPQNKTKPFFLNYIIARLFHYPRAHILNYAVVLPEKKNWAAACEQGSVLASFPDLQIKHFCLLAVCKNEGGGSSPFITRMASVST